MEVWDGFSWYISGISSVCYVLTTVIIYIALTSKCLRTWRHSDCFWNGEVASIIFWFNTNTHTLAWCRARWCLVCRTLSDDWGSFFYKCQFPCLLFACSKNKLYTLQNCCCIYLKWKLNSKEKENFSTKKIIRSEKEKKQSNKHMTKQGWMDVLSLLWAGAIFVYCRFLHWPTLWYVLPVYFIPELHIDNLKLII